MTKKEQALLRKALHHLALPNGYDDAVDILFRLAGMKTPSDHLSHARFLTPVEVMREMAQEAGDENRQSNIKQQGD